MKINEGFELRDVCGAKVVLAFGEEHMDFSKVIMLNETAAYLWQAVQGKEFTADEMVDLLCQEYEVEPAQAKADVEEMLAKWKEQGVVD